MRNTSLTKVTLLLKIDNLDALSIDRNLKRENIPGGWRVHGDDGEQLGEGNAMYQAALSFFARNYGSKTATPQEHCNAVVETLIGRASADQLSRAVSAMIAELQS